MEPPEKCCGIDQTKLLLLPPLAEKFTFPPAATVVPAGATVTPGPTVIVAVAV